MDKLIYFLFSFYSVGAHYNPYNVNHGGPEKDEMNRVSF